MIFVGCSAPLITGASKGPAAYFQDEDEDEEESEDEDENQNGDMKNNNNKNYEFRIFFLV